MHEGEKKACKQRAMQHLCAASAAAAASVGVYEREVCMRLIYL